MAKFCQNCGNEVSENSGFCPKCGSALNGNETVNVNNTININNNNMNCPKVTNRNIVSCILLSIFTCGIYGIYWFIVMTDDANIVSDDKSTSGGLAFLFTLLTCGIYSFYWSYQMGKKLHNAGTKYNKGIQDNSVLYLILSIFGLGIVSYCLIQSDLNRFSD